ncbi:hypothetical protein [Paenibacillus sp. 276b]|uniref:hypothetical protein n=1 Tax=Paenibacillus sp. 276b TaxID=1566277 RepID=UPI000898FE1D|nr:hypothetical protein [Paenibacillus sp. 276b]SEB27560.1 hypothetical protein SAMN03159332_6224 [Paenibacillus sp. 276b]
MSEMILVAIIGLLATCIKFAGTCVKFACVYLEIKNQDKLNRLKSSKKKKNKR